MLNNTQTTSQSSNGTVKASSSTTTTESITITTVATPSSFEVEHSTYVEQGLLNISNGLVVLIFFSASILGVILYNAFNFYKW